MAHYPLIKLSGFPHQKTLFVDPNGNDSTAREGKMWKPWKTINAAIQYLENNYAENYTIWVFPGTYVETTPWVFQFQNKTTIKFNGGVNVNFDVISSYVIRILCEAVSFIGDDRSNTIDMPGAYITVTNESEVLFNIDSVNSGRFRFSNITFDARNTAYGFVLYSCDSLNLHIVNCYIINGRNNIFVAGETIYPRVAITNSLLIADSVSGLRANIYILGQITSPEPQWGGYWFLENSRFVCNYDGSVIERAHIDTINLDSKDAITMIWSGLKFYNNVGKEAIPVWYERTTSGNNKLEIVSTILANSGPDYSSAGSTISYYGNTSLLVTGINVTNPQIINI